MRSLAPRALAATPDLGAYRWRRSDGCHQEGCSGKAETVVLVMLPNGKVCRKRCCGQCSERYPDLSGAVSAIRRPLFSPSPEAA